MNEFLAKKLLLDYINSVIHMLSTKENIEDAMVAHSAIRDGDRKLSSHEFFDENGMYIQDIDVREVFQDNRLIKFASELSDRERVLFTCVIQSAEHNIRAANREFLFEHDEETHEFVKQTTQAMKQSIIASLINIVDSGVKAPGQFTISDELRDRLNTTRNMVTQELVDLAKQKFADCLDRDWAKRFKQLDVQPNKKSILAGRINEVVMPNSKLAKLDALKTVHARLESFKKDNNFDADSLKSCLTEFCKSSRLRSKQENSNTADKIEETFAAVIREQDASKLTL